MQRTSIKSERKSPENLSAIVNHMLLKKKLTHN